MSKFIDLTDQVFTRLTVMQRSENDSAGHTRWKCLCDCGKIKTILGGSLSSGKTKSCGCLQKEIVSTIATTHGKYKHPLYKVWARMLQRCGLTCGASKETKRNYQEKGIRVCHEWKEFVPFFQWASANGWESGLEIDRKNNDKNYTPENCRFVTHKINCQNRRTSKNWFVNGERFSSARDAAEAIGVSRKVIRRMCRGGERDYSSLKY